MRVIVQFEGRFALAYADVMPWRPRLCKRVSWIRAWKGNTGLSWRREFLSTPSLRLEDQTGPSPELWRWSSFRFYWYGEEGQVKVGE